MSKLDNIVDDYSFYPEPAFQKAKLKEDVKNLMLELMLETLNDYTSGMDVADFSRKLREKVAAQ